MDIDKLVMAIVQSDDEDAVTSALNQANLQVTRVSSIGGFLGTHNVTLLIGLQSSDVKQAIDILKTHCHKRTIASSTLFASKETEVGGATLFICDVARYIHLGTYYTADDFQREPSAPGVMQILLAIVSDDQANKLVETLTDWSYRATLISTTGGFLQRGNATLLIGARSERIDSIVDQIRQIGGAKVTDDSIATIFVLNIAQFERI